MLKHNLKFFQIIFVILAFGLSSAAYALHPIQDLTDQPIPEGLSLEQIKKAIKLGGAKRQWAVKEITPGHLEAVLHVRSHVVKTNIHYNQSSYTITYKDSVNMKYKAEGHKIHKNYNSWIQYLNGDIQFNLISMQ